MGLSDLCNMRTTQSAVLISLFLNVVQVPRSSCERVGYFEILGVDAKEGDWVQALVKGECGRGGVCE